MRNFQFYQFLSFVNFMTCIAIDKIDSKKGRTKPILFATTLPLAILFFFFLLSLIYLQKVKLYLLLIAFFGIEGRFKFAPPALLYAVAAFVILMNCAVVCKERVGVKKERIKFKDSIKCAVQSRSWIILCIISFLSFMANTLRGQSCIYYYKWNRIYISRCRYTFFHCS